MILIIRGHIRNSFDTSNLYNLIKEIQKISPSELQIYIHTWNVVANNISWRRIRPNNTMVTNEYIYNYFADLKDFIKDIIIDNDQEIQLTGNIHGRINNGPMPIIGWKNYWYGKWRIIDHIYNKKLDTNTTVLNCRFDILNNSNNFKEIDIIDFIQSNMNRTFTKNVFIKNEECTGIDNIYIGNVSTMYKLTQPFFYDLDNILKTDPKLVTQEYFVFRMNDELFNEDNSSSLI